MTQATTHRYVVTDDQILGGEPIIAGTRTLALPYVFEVFASGIFVAIVVLFSVRFHLAQPSLRKNISL